MSLILYVAEPWIIFRFGQFKKINEGGNVMFELQPFRKGAISKKDFFTNFFDNIFDEDFSPAGVFGSSFKVDVRENYIS